jgi:lysophospholipase L1-like esterase
MGAKPIFCTIANINITKYNHQLLHSNKTHSLLHTHNYPTMQEQINTIIDTINTYIKQTNIENKVSTPFCHSAIKTRKGNKRKYYYTDNWDGLWDGLHATRETRNKWAKSISQAIKHNRATHTHKHTHESSENEEPEKKRAWRNERASGPQ